MALYYSNTNIKRACEYICTKFNNPKFITEDFIRNTLFSGYSESEWIPFAENGLMYYYIQMGESEESLEVYGHIFVTPNALEDDLDIKTWSVDQYIINEVRNQQIGIAH